MLIITLSSVICMMITGLVILSIEHSDNTFRSEHRILLKKMIEYYEAAITEVKNTPDQYDYHKLTSDLNIDLGICWCASKVFKTDLYKQKWVLDRAEKGSEYWHPQLHYRDTNEEVVQKLQFRVDKMRQILQIY